MTTFTCAIQKSETHQPVMIGEHQVNFVQYFGDRDIDFQRWTSDLSKPSSRPYHVNKLRRNFKTLESAVKALLKN